MAQDNEKLSPRDSSLQRAFEVPSSKPTYGTITDEEDLTNWTFVERYLKQRKASDADQIAQTEFSQRMEKSKFRDFLIQFQGWMIVQAAWKEENPHLLLPLGLAVFFYGFTSGNPKRYLQYRRDQKALERKEREEQVDIQTIGEAVAWAKENMKPVVQADGTTAYEYVPSNAEQENS